MTKILQVTPLGDSRFEVLLSLDKERKNFIVNYIQDLYVESLDKFIPYIVPEDTSFLEIWGRELKFRQELTTLIEAIRQGEQIPKAA